VEIDGICWMLPAEFPTFIVASITKKPRSKYWFAGFRDLQGKQRRLSTNRVVFDQ